MGSGLCRAGGFVARVIPEWGCVNQQRLQPIWGLRAPCSQEGEPDITSPPHPQGLLGVLTASGNSGFQEQAVASLPWTAAPGASSARAAPLGELARALWALQPYWFQYLSSCRGGRGGLGHRWERMCIRGHGWPGQGGGMEGSSCVSHACVVGFEYITFVVSIKLLGSGCWQRPRKCW